jgi:hypothetical protein
MVAGALHIRSRMSDSISRQLVTAMERHGFRVEPPDALRVATVPAKRTQPSIRRGRPIRWTEADYARVALLYDDAIAAVPPKSPKREIGRTLSVPPTIAKNLIVGARALQFLPKAAKRGRRGVERLSPARRVELRRLLEGTQ